MKKLIILPLLTACSMYAGGYKIPETSVNGVALSAANVAHSIGVDAAYYNPANMAFMKDGSAIEMDLLIVNLEATHFEGSGTQAGDSIDAESEIFFIPSINYISPKVGNYRFGFSMVVPGGLTKRWTESPAVDKAEQFTLQVVELNPTVAYRVGETLSVAMGARIIHSEGIVKSSSAISRDMEGESFDFGYNLALSYKPTSALEMAVTYRSEIELGQEGTAKLYSPTGLAYDGGATVSVPLPALLNIAIAYTLESKTTIEFVYEKNYWSAYDVLDFGYIEDIGNLTANFDDPIAKDWVDTTAYRLGITQELNDITTLMLGMVIDETPVPDDRVSYELPDSDSISVSLGARYQMNKEMNIGMSALYSMRESREVDNEEITGEFSNSNVLIVSAGVAYKF